MDREVVLEEAASSAPRRAPMQRRSRERVERILAVATELIAADGSDAVRMSDVAARAGVSIGSLYQYFPDKGAIIRVLAERYNAEGRRCIAEALESIGSPTELLSAFGQLVDTYYGMFLAEPAMRDIWSGTQADKGLRDIDLADSRAIGALLAAARRRLHPQADEATLERSSFLLMSLGESTMRLAISVGKEEGAALVETYKRMALRELEQT